MRTLLLCTIIFWGLTPGLLGQNSWSGQFEGKMGMFPAQLQLTQNGAQVTGELTTNAASYPLEGAITGEQLSGRSEDPLLGREMTFAAAWDGPQLVMEFYSTNIFGKEITTRCSFTRSSDSPAAAPTGPAPTSSSAPAREAQPTPATPPAEARTAVSSSPAAAGSWQGHWEGKFGLFAATLQLTRDGNQVNGEMRSVSATYQLQGTLAGNQVTGTASDDLLLRDMPLVMEFSGEQLRVQMTSTNIFGREIVSEGLFQPGQAPVAGTDRQPAGGSPSAPAAGGAPATPVPGQRDPALVGYWRYTDSYTSGDFSAATTTDMQIFADGRYLYGNGRVIGGGDAGSFDSGGGGDVTRGFWKTDNREVYTSTDGQNWERYCRYVIDGGTMMFTFPNGEKQLWYRQ